MDLMSWGYFLSHGFPLLPREEFDFESSEFMFFMLLTLHSPTSKFTAEKHFPKHVLLVQNFVISSECGGITGIGKNGCFV